MSPPTDAQKALDRLRDPTVRHVARFWCDTCSDNRLVTFTNEDDLRHIGGRCRSAWGCKGKMVYGGELPLEEKMRFENRRRRAGWRTGR